MLRPAWVAPINAFEKVAQLRCRDRHRSSVLAHRPDELPRLEPLDIQRHADPIMPQKFYQIALAAAKAEDLTRMWVAPETLLNSQSQGVHTPPHVRHAASDPDLRARRKRDHDGSSACTSRASNPFTKLEDAVARIPGATAETVTVANHDVRSRFFEARVRLRLDDTLIEEHSLIQRNGMTTLVQWRERVAAP